MRQPLRSISLPSVCHIYEATGGWFGRLVKSPRIETVFPTRVGMVQSLAVSLGATLGISEGPIKEGDERASLTGYHDPAPTALKRLLQQLEEVK